MTGLSTASSLSATFLVINLLRIRPRLSFLHGFRGGVPFLEVCFLMGYMEYYWLQDLVSHVSLETHYLGF